MPAPWGKLDSKSSESKAAAAERLQRLERQVAGNSRYSTRIVPPVNQVVASRCRPDSFVQASKNHILNVFFLFFPRSPERGYTRRHVGAQGGAEARCAAIANNPNQRATHADRAAGCSATDAVEERRCANRRSHVAASLPKRPPTSTPTTTKRQRQARTSSGYV